MHLEKKTPTPESGLNEPVKQPPQILFQEELSDSAHPHPDTKQHEQTSTGTQQQVTWGGESTGLSL